MHFKFDLGINHVMMGRVVVKPDQSRLLAGYLHLKLDSSITFSSFADGKLWSSYL